MENFDLVVSIVNRGHSDRVVDAIHEAGAGGGTVIYGRGTSVHDRDSFLGVSIQPEKEIVMTIAPSENKNKIMQAICEKANLNSAGMGICFSLPVTNVRGMNSRPKLPEVQASAEEQPETENE